MVTNEMLDYIRAQKNRGVSREEVTQLLTSDGGWDKSDISEAYEKIESQTEKPKEVAVRGAYVFTAKDSVSNLHSSPEMLAPAVPEPPKEDFLGLLHHPQEKQAPSPVSEISVSAPVATVQELQPGVFSNFLGNKEQSQFVVDHRATQEILGEVKGLEVIHPTGPVASAEPPPTAVAPDLSHLPDVAKPHDGATVHEQDLPEHPLEKQIETRSIAELWVKPDVSFGIPEIPSEVLPVIAQTNTAPVVPTQTTKSPILAMRTPFTQRPASIEAQIPAGIGTSTPLVSSAVGGVPSALKGKRSRQVLVVVLGGVILVLLGVAGTVLMSRVNSLDSATVFSKMYATIPLMNTATYSGVLSVDMEAGVTGPNFLNIEKGVANQISANATYTGKAHIADLDHNDIVQRTKITANVGAGGVVSDIELRLIGDVLYFNLITPPDMIGVDANLLRANWVKIDLRELGGSLALEQVIGTRGEYGRFGKKQFLNTFVDAFSAQTPLILAEELLPEMVDKTQTYHYRVRLDPNRSLAVVNSILKQIDGSPVTLSDEDKIHFADLLSKVTGEVWIDRSNFQLKKFTFQVEANHEFAGLRFKGTASTTNTFKDIGTPFLAELPTPVISLDELGARITDARADNERRARDAESISVVVRVRDALSRYYAKTNRYPRELTTLVTEGYLDKRTIVKEGASTYVGVSFPVLNQSECAQASTTTLCKSTRPPQILYATYISATRMQKQDRCVGTAVCLSYHLGIGLESPNTLELATDSDRSGDAISGSDTSGCAGEPGRYCYDVSSLPNGKGEN